MVKGTIIQSGTDPREIEHLIIKEAFESGAAYDFFAEMMARNFRALGLGQAALIDAFKKRDAFSALQEQLITVEAYVVWLKYISQTISANKPGAYHRKERVEEKVSGDTNHWREFGLSKEQWEMPISALFGNATKFHVRTAHLLEKAKFLTLGQLLLHTRGNPKRLLSLPGVGTKMLQLVSASFVKQGVITARKVGKRRKKTRRTATKRNLRSDTAAIIAGGKLRDALTSESSVTPTESPV